MHGLIERHVRGYGLVEGIEVDDNEIDRAVAVLRECSHVAFDVALSEDAGMHRRVQRLDTAAQDFGVAGQLTYIGYGQARFTQSARRAAG